MASVTSFNIYDAVATFATNVTATGRVFALNKEDGTERTEAQQSTYCGEWFGNSTSKFFEQINEVFGGTTQIVGLDIGGDLNVDGTFTIGGVPFGLIADGTTTSASMRWSGTAWAENTSVLNATDQIYLTGADPAIRAGGGSGDPLFQVVAGAGNTGAFYFHKTDVTASDGDFRYLHDASETFGLQAYYSAAWNWVWSAASATSDVTFHSASTIFNDANAGLYIGDGTAFPRVQLDKGDASGAAPVDLLNAGVRRWLWQFTSSEALTMNRYDSGGVFAGAPWSMDTAGNWTIAEDNTSTDILSSNVTIGSVTTAGLTRIRSAGTTLWDFQSDGGLVPGAGTQNIGASTARVSTFWLGSHIDMAEVASVSAPAAGAARWWVRNDVPNVPMFTDDTDTDYVLAYASDLIADGATTDSVLRWSGSAWAEEDSVLVSATGDLTQDSASPTLRLGDSSGNPQHMIKKAAAGIGRLYFLDTDETPGVGDYQFLHNSDETFHFRRHTGAVWESVWFVPDPAANNINFTGNVTIGDFGGQANQYFHKAEASESIQTFYNADITPSDGDFRHLHDSSETFGLQSRFSGAWNWVWSVVSAGDTVLFAGDVTIGGVTQTAGIADGTTDGSPLVWDTGGSTWIEETTSTFGTHGLDVVGNNSAARVRIGNTTATTPRFEILKVTGGTSYFDWYDASDLRWRHWFSTGGNYRIARYTGASVYQDDSITIDATGYVELANSTWRFDNSAGLLSSVAGAELSIGRGVGTALATANVIEAIGGSVGGVLVSNSETNLVAKSTYIGTLHYTSDTEEPFYGILIQGLDGDNLVQIGGGAGGGNAATQVNIRLAPDSVTTTGTTEWIWTAGSLTSISGSKLGLGIGVGSAIDTDAVLEAVGGAGVLLMQDNGTNATQKEFGLASYHYTSDTEEPFGILFASAEVATNNINYGGSNPAYNAAEQHSWWTAATHTSLTGTEQLRLTNSELSTAANMHLSIGGGVGTTTIGALDLYGASGVIRVESVSTDATQKDFSIRSEHYTVAEEDIQLITASSQASDTFISIGGSGGSFNHPTRIRVATAATNTSTTATEHWEFDASGHLVPLNSGRNIGDTNDGLNHLFFDETASTPSPANGFGAHWTQNSTPNTAMFTSDDGLDHPISLMPEIHLHAGNAAQDPADTYLRGDTAQGNVTRAVLGSSTERAVLSMVAGANDEEATWDCYLPASYSGGGLTVQIEWAPSTTNTGAVAFESSFEYQSTGTVLTGAASFATAQTASPTPGGVAAAVERTTIAHTNSQIDGLQAGTKFRYRLARAGSDAFTGNVYISGVRIYETNGLADA